MKVTQARHRSGISAGVTFLAATLVWQAAACSALAKDGENLPPLVTRPIVVAIHRGLDYLASVQQPNGSLTASWAGDSYPCTMTALAGLAFLANGSTPEEGPYAENVKRAMVYLMDIGDRHHNGLIAGKGEARATYGHGFAMTMLGLCYGMTHNTEYDERLKHTLNRAIMLVAQGQSRKGGWLYTPVGGADEGSTTACVLQGLRACRNGGLKVPTETIERAVAYLRDCQNPDGGLVYSSSNRGSSHKAISVAAITCFYSAGIYDRVAGGASAEATFVDKLWRYVDHAVKDFSDNKAFNVYLNFYLAQAKYQRGGIHWEKYYTQISRDLLSSQAANGSWPGEDVGPPYGTAVACMILQLPYGYLPICER